MPACKDSKGALGTKSATTSLMHLGNFAFGLGGEAVW